MKLPTQLILLSLLTLSLPWAGCEYIREMETTLRQGQAQNLLTTTRTIAHVLSYEDRKLFNYAQLNSDGNTAANNIYAYALDSKIVLDGYSDDWGGLWEQYRYFPNQLTQQTELAPGVICAGNKDYIFLYVSARDKQVMYYDPARGLINGDRLQLLIETHDGTPRQYSLMTSAPGKITAQYIRNPDALNPQLRQEPRIHGQWQDTAEGYNIEIRIPRRLLTGHFNFAVVDEDTGGQLQGWYGSWDYSTHSNNGLILEASPQLEAVVNKFRQQDARLRVTSLQGWLLASVGSPVSEQSSAQPLRLNETLSAILNQLYHFIMYFSERSEPAVNIEQGRMSGYIIQRAFDKQGATAWFKPQRSNRAIVNATYPVIQDEQVVAVVIADQSSDAILTLTNHALNRLIAISSITILLAAGGLLGYATYLSVRIRRLRNATENMIANDGRISDNFTASRAGDELGDLSRSFADMHQRLQEYTQYLRSLASKLSHELRTPLAVVQSSLDNIHEDSNSDDIARYTQRARDGSERLGKIITALSEASRVEQSIRSTELEGFDMCAVIGSSVEAYSDIYPQHGFDRIICEQPCMVFGSPDLLVQLLDKLVDNAVDFSTDDGRIHVSVNRDKDKVQLSVRNRGPLLPRHMSHQLFDSMVSMRDERNDKPHLGLGLYIVKLISDAHGGQVHAHNVDNPQGVEFVVELPLADT